MTEASSKVQCLKAIKHYGYGTVFFLIFFHKKLRSCSLWAINMVDIPLEQL